MKKNIVLILICLLLPLSVFSQGISKAPDSAETVLAGELCEPGSILITIPADICADKFGVTTECSICAFCGDGILVPQAPLNEQCDGTVFASEYQNVNPKSCSSSCTVLYCGDNIRDNSELCDGKQFSSAFDQYPKKSCTSQCDVLYCGDNVIQDSNNEQCDGTATPAGQSCRSDCTLRGCGDGYYDQDLGETCDPTLTSGPGYAANCRASGTNKCTYCGDNLIQSSQEQCDGSNLNGVSDPDAVCGSNCQFLPYCGDGKVTAPEVCDPAVIPADPLCQENCTYFACNDGDPKCGPFCKDKLGNTVECCRCPVCGDGFFDPEKGEKCDPSIPAGQPGYQADCRSDCSYCGDAVRNGSEVCDGNDFGPNGKPNPNAVCSPQCTIESYCGDGVKNGTEICDGNDFGPAGKPNPAAVCSAQCTINPYCGDGVKSETEICDGNDFGPAGKPNPAAVCSAQCNINPYCGDGVKSETEICDGNDFGPAGKPNPAAVCSAQCNINPYCGDGVKSETEICDGNDFGPAGKPNPAAVCSAQCTINPYCGDGVKSETEICDGNDFGPAGKPNPAAVCSAQCNINPYCGDGVKSETEICDGNDFGPAGKPNPAAVCSAQCTINPYCGDGVKSETEICDGNDFGPAGKPNPAAVCSAQCNINPYCGDGVKSETEICDGNDFGPAGKPNPAAVCSAQCNINPYCGDGVKSETEICDGNDFGPAGKPNPAAVCSAQCTINPYCGDGVKSETEICDGNDFGPAGKPNPAAVCSAQCTINPYCGDGVKSETEICDGNDFGPAGKPNPAATCSPQCNINPYCGDGIRASNEACDGSDFGIADGVQSGTPGQVCSATCTVNPFCGDGIVGNTSGEQCDDGNTVDTDDCSNTCQNTCKYYSIQAISTGNSTSELNQKIIDTDNQNIPSCLLNKITAAFSACGGNFNEAGGTYSKTSNDVRNGAGTGLGICVTTKIFDSGLQPSFYYTEKGVSYGSEFAQYLAGGAAKIGMPYKMFMDKNCNIVDYSVKCKAGVAVPCKDTDLIADPDFSSRNNDVCGTVEARNGMSPISLLWDEDSSVDTEHALVSFPINPNEEGKLFSWKASSSTPLLVFDPAGSGKITNASQLFGNWTFGGKDSGAIRNVALNSNGNLEPWQDGYEALATLDQNHDGMLNGAELAGLSLWFDADRDGVSDTGEVKRLSEVGVTELYTKHDGKDLQTGDIYASIGFKRGNYTGRTVDWFASSYNSLEQAQVLMQRSAQASQQVQAKPESEKVEPVLKAGDSDSIRNAVAGVWTWSDPQTNGSGFLILEINDKLEVAGRSLSEIRFQQNADNINSQIASYFLNGNAQAKGSDIALNFKVTGEGSHYAQTEAVLDSAGILKGKTTEHYGADKAAISYNWTAKRYQP